MSAELRNQLQIAQDGIAAAAAEKAATQDALARGQTLLAGLEREMSAFSDLDGSVARHRAAAIRGGANASEPLPATLTARLEARGRLQSEIDSYRVAVGELADDCKRAAEGEAHHRAKAGELVRQIIGAEADALAEVLLDLELQAFAVRLRLVGLSHLTFPTPSGMLFASMARNTIDAIGRRYDRAVTDGERQAATGEWAIYRERLMADAAAGLRSDAELEAMS